MHEPPDLFGGRRKGVGADNDVHCLRGAQQVADRADPAQPLDDRRDLPVQASLDEPFEPAELDDVQTRLLDASLSHRDGG